VPTLKAKRAAAFCITSVAYTIYKASIFKGGFSRKERCGGNLEKFHFAHGRVALRYHRTFLTRYLNFYILPRDAIL